MTGAGAAKKAANGAEKAAARPITPKRIESDEDEGILIPGTPLIAGESPGEPQSGTPYYFIGGPKGMGGGERYL
jgi:hypothetical protein